MFSIFSIFKALSILSIIFAPPTYAYLDWGHLVTGTTDQLEAGQGTIGTSITGYGINDTITVGTSPLMYLGYDFYSFLSRLSLISGENYKLGADIFYFVSSPSRRERSHYDQQSWYFRLNQTYKFSPKVRVHATASLQYFVREISTFSLRSDPLGRWISFASKLSDNHQDKLLDYENNPRDPKTFSLSIMPSFMLSSSTFLNVEYGRLGINYKRSLKHYGISLTRSWVNFDITIGGSISSRTLNFGPERLSHFESRLQFYF